MMKNKVNDIEKMFIPPELMSDTEMIRYYYGLSKSLEKSFLDGIKDTHYLIHILESLQNNSDWRNIRAVLAVMDEYSKQINQTVALPYLYKLFSHNNGIIRKNAAQTAGHLLAECVLLYPDVWNEFLHKILFPGNNVSDSDKRRIGYCLKDVLHSILEQTDSTSGKNILNNYVSYFKSTKWENLTCNILLHGISDIRYDLWSTNQRFYIINFVRQLASGENEEIRIESLLLVEKWMDQGWKSEDDVKSYLMERLVKNAASNEENDFILTNFRPDTSWILKVANLNILKEHYTKSIQDRTISEDKISRYAAHLLNMIRLNMHSLVSFQAGKDLISIFPFLNSQQQYEIVQELMKEIELFDDVDHGIPEILGSVFLCLPIQNQIELLPCFRKMADSDSSYTVCTTMEAICSILRNIMSYIRTRQEIEVLLQRELTFFTGILCQGIVHYKSSIAREAMYLVTNDLFKKQIILGDYDVYMRHLGRSILININQDMEGVTKLYNLLSLKYICNYFDKYISTENMEKKEIAFFSGSFDPFTLGHKAVARELAEMGYQVYVNTHDFSWCKNTQPDNFRRKMIELSIAGLMDVSLFPENIPICFENTNDLNHLRELFPNQKIHIVVGSDVIETNKAYLKEPEEDSIHSFAHIIICRNSTQGMINHDKIERLIANQVDYLQLPVYYDVMNSQNVQNRIAQGKDISEYVEVQVQKLIYDRKLYQGMPLYKKSVSTKPLKVAHSDYQTFFNDADVIQKYNLQKNVFPDEKIISLEDERRNNEICAGVIYHEINLTDLYAECGDINLASSLHEILSGKIVSITDIFGEEDDFEDCRDEALNEALAYFQAKQYSYVVCLYMGKLSKLLKRYGFVCIPEYKDCYLVNLSRPLVTFFDVSSFIRKPFSEHPLIRKELRQCRLRLQEALSKLYPGYLILNFDSEMINYRLIKMLSQEEDINEKSGEVSDTMCVPFGKILKGVRIPNKVTKELITEKCYDGNLTHFKICEFPNYPALVSQIRTIKSFSKPVILIDDLYHNGYRFQKIRHIMEQEDVKIHQYMVGVISGKGCDLSQKNEMTVKAVYTVPNMRAWLLESDLYPFIGGDGVVSTDQNDTLLTALPSINTILPYQIPGFLHEASRESLYRLSEVCLNNVQSLYETLEKIYQDKYNSNLTLERIGDVIAEPRYPEGMINIGNSVGKTISSLLEHEKQMLVRLRHIAD